MGDVVRLVDRAAGFSPDDESGLLQWAQDWLDALKNGDYGQFRSIVFVLESKDGQVATLAQSMTAMDGVRLVGLLQHVAHRRLDGKGDISDLKLPPQ